MWVDGLVKETVTVCMHAFICAHTSKHLLIIIYLWPQEFSAHIHHLNYFIALSFKFCFFLSSYLETPCCAIHVYFIFSFFKDGLKTLDHFRGFVEGLFGQLIKIKQKQESERKQLIELRDALKGSMSSYKEVRRTLFVTWFKNEFLI